MASPRNWLLWCVAVVGLGPSLAPADDNPFRQHGPLRVAKSGTHLEHTDGTPFFFLADTTWNGPALSTADEWKRYLQDRKKKGFTAIQFNAICPWRAAPTDREGRTAYTLQAGQLVPNEEYFRQLDARIQAITEAGLLAVPVLVWAHKPGDAGFDLNEEQLRTLIQFELKRYKDTPCLFILAGDARYNATEAPKWKRIGQAVFKDYPGLLVTTHPTGMNFPWKDWEDERWLTVLGYQSGHGDDAATLKWIHSGPPAEYGRRETFTRPLINLEPPYEGHVAYQSRKPHTASSVRRAVYWSLLSAPVAGVTYGGHGVWSWHTQPGAEPTDHRGSGVAPVWTEALALPGAAQMGHVRKLFEALPWTKLRPDPAAVQQETGTTDPARFVAAARTPDRSTFVFYFPAGATAKIPLEVGSKNDAVRWFNPRTGEWVAGTTTAGRFTPPDTEDWVLVVQP